MRARVRARVRASMARETPAQAFKLTSHNSRLFSWLQTMSEQRGGR